MLSKRVTQYLAMLTLALMHLNHQRMPSYLVGLEFFPLNAVIFDQFSLSLFPTLCL